MEKTYSPSEFEARIYAEWENSGCFNPDGDANLHSPGNGKPFLITMPPPNVTGVLHQGHALFASIEDAYARWMRMRGYKVLWLPGTDHAGIATQLMVERLLESEGSSRLEVGREEFLKRTWDWKEKHGGIIQKQLRALGSSCDWSRERFTMDEVSTRSVRESFMRFFHDGLIYRGERLVNWSTGLDTAVSDLEVVSKSVDGFLYHIRYELEDGSDSLVVATTRPETLFADVAVAVHPEDERFTKFHGKKIRVPIANRLVPVITDDYVDKDFGTGALKITPGHDHNDWEIGKRHQLATLSVISRKATLTDLAGEFSGMTVKAGRKATVEKLEELGLLVEKKKYTNEVGHCERSGVVIEPLVSTQWFMKMQPLADKALQAAKTPNRDKRALRFFPDFWEKTYFEWLENIQDWCISRQLWWGHQIPAWHCSECDHITVPKSTAEPDPIKCAGCGSGKITQDNDVLDTWYSSGLWPITTLGWPNETADLNFFYPQTKFNQERDHNNLQSLMETGSDIIFFWVARMMMMCTHLMDGRIPFEDVYLHAMVRDEKGQKMSKVKGNVVDPMTIINEHGADALRLTLLVLSGGGRNVNFNMSRLEGYKGFLNKLWNAVRFTLPNIESMNGDLSEAPTKEELAESSFVNRWILQRLNETVAEVNHHFIEYRFDMAFNGLYQFFWYEFCDWYLESYKNLDKTKTDQKTLAYCIDQTLKLLHPLCPFITEEIYQSMPGQKSASISQAVFPVAKSGSQFGSVEDVQLFSHLKAVVEGLRNFRTENTISPKIEIACQLTKKDSAVWPKIEASVVKLAKVQFTATDADVAAGPSGQVSTGDFDIVIPLAGLVDFEAEAKRLNAQILKIRKELEGIQKRLSNRGFVERANPEVVAKEQAKESELSKKLKALEESVANLPQ